MPSIEFRKVIEIETTKYISIPKPFCDFHDIRKGDALEVITNGKITIKPLKRKREDKR